MPWDSSPLKELFLPLSLSDNNYMYLYAIKGSKWITDSSIDESQVEIHASPSIVGLSHPVEGYMSHDRGYTSSHDKRYISHDRRHTSHDKRDDRGHTSHDKRDISHDRRHTSHDKRDILYQGLIDSFREEGICN